MLNPSCLLSRLQWVCSRVPGNRPSRPPPQAAHPHPATPLLCPLWPLLPTFSRHVYTSASNPTLTTTLASVNSLQHKAISPSCPNQPCGGWARSPAQTSICRSWVCLDSSSSSAAVWWWSKSSAKRDRRMFSWWKSQKRLDAERRRKESRSEEQQKKQTRVTNLSLWGTRENVSAHVFAVCMCFF